MKVLILLTIPIILTTLYYSYMFNDINISFNIGKLENVIDLVYENLNKLKYKENALNSLIKLPAYLSRYNIYLENNIMGITEDGKDVITEIRIKIDDYKEIRSGEKKKIINFLSIKNIDSDEIKKINYSYSFRCYFKDNLKKQVPETTKCQASPNINHLKLYLKPTIFSAFIVFILVLAIWYGFLLLINGCYKFIRYGRPFIEK